MTSVAVDTDRLRDDVESLAGMVRGSAGPGERASAAWIAGRMGEAGIADVAVEPYRYQSTYAGAHGLHVAAGLLAARLGGRLGAALAAAALGSLELDVSGRSQWTRRLLPSGEGANVVARIPAAGERRGTLVLLAHHDAARTGLAWHPALIGVGAGRAAKTRKMEPRMVLPAVGFGLVGLGSATGARALRRIGAGILWATLASYADVGTSRTVAGANDNASGVAAVLALARGLAAEPLADADTILLTPGSEESGMGGMAAFLGAHGAELHPESTLVVSLDSLGSGTPVVCRSEGTLLRHRYGAAELDLADEGARRAGLPAPERWDFGAWTDPILARASGLPALSILSLDGGVLPNWHWPTDTPSRVDHDCVARCARLAAGIAEVWADRLTTGAGH